MIGSSIMEQTYSWHNSSLSVQQGTLVCFLGEREWVRGLLHFLLLIAWQPPGGFSSYLAHVCSSPGKNFKYSVMTFQPIREVT